jgi:hypothetical protein
MSKQEEGPMANRQKAVPGLRPAQDKKPYSTPKLQIYGDIRDLTLGPTPGNGESGNVLVYRRKVHP